MFVKIYMNKQSGLTNIGNTCYLNSALQLFIRCSVLTKFILSNNFYHHNLNTYKNFIQLYQSNNVVTPAPIKQIVAQKNPQFSGTSQNDSHEFLITLIDLLDSALNEEFEYIKRRNLGTAMLESGLLMNQILSKLFESKIVSTLICPKCKNVSKTSNMEKMLSLPLPTNEANISLIDCFNYFLQSEKLNDQNMWNCDACKKEVNATKKITIPSSPKYLFIQLKRFHFGKNSSKINNPVEIPMEWLLNENKYLLRGFIVHSGGSNGGHYVSYCMDIDKWYLFNDGSVSQVNDEEIIKCARTSYILLYVKTKNDIK